MDDKVRDIAKALNESQILWGIGGSYLLKSYGIVKEVHDLDLIIAEKDITKAIEIFDEIGEKKKIPNKVQYKTKHFHIYDYKGLSIDLMSGFQIEHEEGLYQFPLDEKSIIKTWDRDGVKIPFTSLEDWLIAYMLITGRESKVKLIADYLVTSSDIHLDLFERILELQLPTSVREYLVDFIRKITP